jgi:hypothetical protein
MNSRYWIIGGLVLLLIGAWLLYPRENPRNHTVQGLISYSEVFVERGSGEQGKERYRIKGELTPVPNQPHKGEPFKAELVLHLDDVTVNGNSKDPNDPVFQDWHKNVRVQLDVDGTLSDWRTPDQTGHMVWPVSARQTDDTVLVAYAKTVNGAELNESYFQSMTIHLETASSTLLHEVGGTCLSLLGVLGNVTGLLVFLRDRGKKRSPGKK